MIKKVIYTSIFGSEYYLHDPEVKQKSNWNYICFTDNPNYKSDFWCVVLVPKMYDGARDSKKPKILPHRYLQDYDISVWIDGDVKITGTQFELKKKIERAKKELYDKKVGSLLSFLQAQDATLAAEKSYSGSKAALSAKLFDKGTLKADMDEFVGKWSSGLGEKLAKEQETVIQLTQSGLKFSQSVQNVEVRSPADGIVSQISEVKGPVELGLENKQFTRVSIFMNVFNCHVNRFPSSGKIDKIFYKPGKYLNASLDKSSDENERNYIKFTNFNGDEMILVQIAGLIARRIVCDVKENSEVKQGDRFGIIRFGSRVDLYFSNYKIMVKKNQKMIAGETIVARKN